ncbi:hypothetical protein J2Y54_000588 [Sphingomonas sp. BE123]|uniref:hypothetical protein n=1 Tax=Sphingomonas sp. BE123 TaxID=2817842 RepID=UPI0028565FB1|nr:hypothetical protein [Sphingomonas sp. BE123]MDR6851095.1 hypothetical protein [Sphingomonas sp. BE123]
MSKKSAFIISSFTDAGTTARYAAGSIEKIGEGEYGNYVAAGLVREPTEADMKAAEDGAPVRTPPANTTAAAAKAPAKAAPKA